ncbi:MAG: tetratricopeptide repeat protein [Thermodesulfobacteriota bacterium]
MIDRDEILKKAMELHQAGRLDQAEALYRRFLEERSDHPEAWHLLALVVGRKGRHEEAAAFIERSIALGRPPRPQAYQDLGLAWLALDRVADAIRAWEQALSLKPDDVETLNNLGVAFRRLGHLEPAAECFRRAAEINPDDPRTLSHLAAILRETGEPGRAAALAERVLAGRPDDPAAHLNLGNIHLDLGDPGRAAVHLNQALRLNPGLAEAHNSLGVALAELGRGPEAEPCYQAALKINPGLAGAWFNLGNLLIEQNRLAEAETHYRRAVAIKPDYSEACAAWFKVLQKTCDWRSLSEVGARLDDLTGRELSAGVRTGEMPFIAVTRDEDPARHLAVARSWGAYYARRAKALDIAFSFDRRPARRGPIVLGYLSSDFHNHATAHLLSGLFSLHDRRRFTVQVYSYGPDDGSVYRRRISRDCDLFVDIAAMSDLEAARLIHERQVDILVDLKGHTRGGRLGIPALRPAPVQVHYLGYPGALGADFIDYLLADAVVTPPEHASFYTEKLVLLPGCYQINDHRQPVSPRPFRRSDFGLPEAAFVFCSFNQSYKIHPNVFQSWTRILQEVPGGVLWLLGDSPAAAAGLRREAGNRGLDPGRLIFASRLPKAEHLARLKLADLALDTSPINGHTTTSDALWAGTPVVACLGRHFAGRVSASLLAACGLPDMIAGSPEEYESLAVKLARDPAALGSIKSRLAQNKHSQALFDTPRFVLGLERAYERMWELFVSGHGPESWTVAEE